jgi:hypothetical protein
MDTHLRVETASRDKLYDVAQVLKCPVCNLLPHGGIKIYECRNSHIICSTCANRMAEKKCPTCRVDLSINKRHRIAEKILLTFDCHVPKLKDSSIVMQKQWLKDLQDLLECPVCLSIPGAGTAVYKCCNSHIICGTCAEQMPDRKCPTCRVTFSVKKRCQLTEMIIDKIEYKVPCWHARRGCNHSANNSMIKEHELNCQSRPVKCLNKVCSQIVNLDKLFDHAWKKHKYQKSESTGDVIFEPVLAEDDQVFKDIYADWHHHFHVVKGQTYVPIIWKEHGTFHAMLYILASKEVAKKYKVDISITVEDFRIGYKTNVVSIDTPICEAMKNEENSLPLTNFQAKKCIRDYNAKKIVFVFQVLKY